MLQMGAGAGCACGLMQVYPAGGLNGVARRSIGATLPDNSGGSMIARDIDGDPCSSLTRILMFARSLHSGATTAARRGPVVLGLVWTAELCAGPPLTLALVPSPCGKSSRQYPPSPSGALSCCVGTPDPATARAGSSGVATVGKMRAANA